MVPSIYGENMFDEFFDNNGFFGSHSPLFGKNSKNLMKTDIRETDDAKAYRFAVELPGFKKDEISLDIKDGYLTIAAQKGLDKDEQDKKGRVLRQERYAGACSRSFYVGNVKPEDVKAKYEDGVLSVIVPQGGREEARLFYRNRHRVISKHQPVACGFAGGWLFYCFRNVFPATQMPARISATDKPIRTPEMKFCTSVPPVVLDMAPLAMPRICSLS